MKEEKIKRINELYHKSKAEGLTEAEKKEQKILRQEYIEAFRENLRGQLNQISIKEKDGTIINLGEKYGEKYMKEKTVLDIRNRIPAEIRRQKSMEITDRVCKMSCFLRASSILIYRNFRSEVETGMLIEAGWEMGKEVFCPRVEGKEMEFYR